MIPTPGISTEFDLIPVILIVLIMGTGIVGWILNRAEKLWFAVGVWLITLGLAGVSTMYAAVKMGWITL